MVAVCPVRIFTALATVRLVRARIVLLEAKVTVPVPSALLLLIATVPELSVLPPV